MDIDGIEMTEDNYIELRRAAGGMSVSITTMMEFGVQLYSSISMREGGGVIHLTWQDK